MLNIAIVEDDTQQAAQLESALKTYGSEYGAFVRNNISLCSGFSRELLCKI